MNETNDEFTGIPDMPSADAMRSELLRTGGPSFWRPHGTPDGTASNLSEADPTLAYKAMEARIAIGPGPHGNHYQWALWHHHQAVDKLETEQDALLAKISEVRYDAETGEPAPVLTPQERERIAVRIAALTGELERKQGEPGKKAMAGKLEEAVRKERQKYAEVYMLREAERRAAANAMEDRINDLAETVFKQGAAKLTNRK
ncbi:hypothetical protein FSZ31_11900 [Sphingorhabdus soli]|uniref:Uncharacterized protein n=1 Tax=Flavisphingopyxis soli TaxID=2601267 RepID=A0A5C6U680_9SPHN|nr:hypothetical protein [Sphingorhabdus soli]TXC68367.1 hypothetical protein FSZ31_11900 [Sphingorhabdus soli]